MKSWAYHTEEAQSKATAEYTDNKTIGSSDDPIKYEALSKRGHITLCIASKTKTAVIDLLLDGDGRASATHACHVHK